MNILQLTQEMIDDGCESNTISAMEEMVMGVMIQYKRRVIPEVIMRQVLVERNGRPQTIMLMLDYSYAAMSQIDEWEISQACGGHANETIERSL
jgi:hypothetical protein